MCKNINNTAKEKALEKMEYASMVLHLLEELESERGYITAPYNYEEHKCVERDPAEFSHDEVLKLKVIDELYSKVAEL